MGHRRRKHKHNHRRTNDDRYKKNMLDKVIGIIYIINSILSGVLLISIILAGFNGTSTKTLNIAFILTLAMLCVFTVAKK